MPIMRRAVQASIANILGPEILASEAPQGPLSVPRHPALYAKVWQHVPRPTAGGRTQAVAAFNDFTNLGSTTLLNAAATVVEKQAPLIAEQIRGCARSCGTRTPTARRRSGRRSPEMTITTTENRFLDSGHARGRAPSGGRGWAASMATTDRVLVVLIENGGIDLQLTDLVDKLVDEIPGASTVISKGLKDQVASALNDWIKSTTDNALESAELALNRYTDAKPGTYGDVVVLRDSTATFGELKSALFTATRAGKVIDLVILTHGSRSSSRPVTASTPPASGRWPPSLAARSSLRSVYMMNCVGASLNQAWLDVGARTSAGSHDNNYLPEPTTFFFFTAWKGGTPFEQAVTGAYRQTIDAMNSALRGIVTALVPLAGVMLADKIDVGTMSFVVSSRPEVVGAGALTVSSDTLPAAAGAHGASSAQSMVTTVLPAGRALVRPMSVERTVSPSGRTFISRFEAPGPLLDQRITAVERFLSERIARPLSQPQIDALASFGVGVGSQAFLHSTLLRMLDAGDLNAVPAELRKWTKLRKDGQIVESEQLLERRRAEAELFARADGSPTPPAGVVSQSLGAVDYTVLGVVAPLKQPSPRTCWATAIAMMTSWKRQQSIAPRDAIAPGGPEYLARLDNDQVLTAETAGRLYQSLGLVAMISLNPSIDGWDQYLRLYGPLYVDIGYPQQSTTHAVVVTAISGDGSATGTKITYIDPAMGQTIVRVFADFLAEYESPAAVNTWPYVITHWPAAGEAAQSLPTTGVYTYETSVHPPLSQAQFLIAGIAVADAIQIGLASVSIAQAGASASAGTFSLTYDKAQRLLTGDARAAMPGAQATTHKYTHRLFSVGTSRPGTASAVVTIEWEGNAYGEIGTPVIRRDLANSTEWSHSSCSFAITKLDRIPPADTDPRSWPVLYTYDGTYDPVGNGYFEFSGEFQINAFGALRFNRHQVVSRSLADFLLIDKPDECVARGADVAAAVPDIPADQVAYLRAHLP